MGPSFPLSNLNLLKRCPSREIRRSRSSPSRFFLPFRPSASRVSLAGPSRRPLFPSRYISPTLQPPPYPTTLSQTLLADETRFVLNFLDRAFRNEPHEFAWSLVHAALGCILDVAGRVSANFEHELH